MPRLSKVNMKLDAPILPYARSKSLSEGIAHDCNSILAGIVGHAELALESISDGNPARNHVRQVITGCLCVQEFVRQNVVCGHAVAQERKLVQLRGIVEELLALLSPSLPPPTHIFLNYRCKFSTILADQSQIYQVLLNLFNNAGEAMTETDGILSVAIKQVMVTESFTRKYSVLKRGPHMCLTVRDTGHGMTPEVQARIFEPFFTTKLVKEGTGIGLGVVQTIVRNHGGEILVDSVFGRGTTFTIYLPSIPEEYRRNEQSKPSMAEEKKTILFVADHEPVYVMGQEILEWLGYEVIVRTKSAEALETFNQMQNRFDLVLADDEMSNMKAEDFIRGLKKIHPDIPIILSTGPGKKFSQERANAIGIQAVLRRPLILDEVEEIIQQVLAQSDKEGLRYA